MNEMKLYEKLGIKQFRKFVFGVFYAICLPFSIVLHVPKEELKRHIKETPTNYSIGKDRSYEKVKNFKKMLYLNAFLHINGLIVCGNTLIKLLNSISNIATISVVAGCILLNTYCIMLQRYNYLKINKTLEKLKPKYEKEKNELKQEIKESDNKIVEHEYIYTKLGDKTSKEKNVNFDTLLNNASLEQLKTYKKELEDFNKYSETFTNYYQDKPYTVSIENNKVLKLKIKNK